MKAAIGGLALLWCTAETAPDPGPSQRLIADLRAAATAAEQGDCATALRSADKVRRAREFGTLPQELRVMVLQLAGLCEVDRGKHADAYRDLVAATAFAEASDDSWRMRLAYELDDKRYADAIKTVEAMANGRGAALASVPVRWFYQFDNQLKTAGDTATRRRLLTVLTQSGYQPDEAGVNGDAFRFRYADLLAAAGEQEAALAQVRQVEAPTLIVELSLDPRFRAAFPADLLVRPLVELWLGRLREAAASHPDQIGPVNDVATMLRLLGRPREALAALEAIRAKVEGDAELSDRGDQAVWWWDQLALAHLALGDRAAEIAALERGSAIEEGGGVNVSQTINLAEAQLAAGRPADTLRTLARLDGKGSAVAPYGTMQIVADRGCARVRLGSAADAKDDIAFARAHAADAPQALVRLLMCAGDMDGAAQATIARLANPDQRVAALRDLSEYAPPPVPIDDPAAARLRALKARADVQAAMAKAGGMRRFDIQRLDG